MALQSVASTDTSTQADVRHRLLRDVRDLKRDPYPYISFYPTDDLTKSCLILTPPGREPLHLTMELEGFPYKPPRVSIQTKVSHPNVFDSYICASILNTAEGYTPAYTLKSIAIQLLSFFSSETIEQTYGGSISLENFRLTAVETVSCRDLTQSLFRRDKVVCPDCLFDSRKTVHYNFDTPEASKRRKVSPGWSAFSSIRVKLPGHSARTVQTGQSAYSKRASKKTNNAACPALQSTLSALPDEVLLQILEELPSSDVSALSKAYSRVSSMLQSYDFIRMRELQCFFLKDNFLSLKLGVGVAVNARRGSDNFASEFDLLSKQAFYDHQIRTSIHGLPFQQWLPLPLSRRHWRSNRDEADQSVRQLALLAGFPNEPQLKILARFMNDIVIKFSQETDNLSSMSPYSYTYQTQSRSTLRHASEKAVEAYTALFHLLLCMATEPANNIISQANMMVDDFLAGATSKQSCPNLGLLLVATLISTHGLTESVMRAIIGEAVKRNVVWMLDAKGANLPELVYLEPSGVSHYRLEKTFNASLTSYRLLMFCNLFYRIARVNSTKPLSTIRDELFDRHGAPPPGAAAQMAADIRRIKTINSFPAFMEEVGMRNIPSDAELTNFLREMVVESEKVGYSKMAISQSRAYSLRVMKEPDVEMVDGLNLQMGLPKGGVGSFFPGNKKNKKGR